MKIKVLSFTKDGISIANKLKKLEEKFHEVEICSLNGKSLNEWTRNSFNSDAIVFVSAIGIAVRAISPFVKDKLKDPAIIVIDDLGRYIIPILSGHVGGANKLSKEISEIIEADTIITTATDIRGLFAIDTWASESGFHIHNKDMIKNISTDIINGKTVNINSDFCLKNYRKELKVSKDSKVYLTYKEPDSNSKLYLIVPSLSLGIGCRKNTNKAQIESLFNDLLIKSKISIKALKSISSIELKKDENGILEFADSLGLKNSLKFFTVKELKDVEGDFTSSSFVEKITGVDNVCERSAVKRNSGKLIIKKMSKDGVTMALSLEEKYIEVK